MDKYKKIVFKLLSIYGSEAMEEMKAYHIKKNDSSLWFHKYALDSLQYAIRAFKTYQTYRTILEATKGYHSEWI